jgi:pimeloyl-ACP methyl ester carboxylesterase
VADDLHALAEHLVLDRFHLVGIAGGGYVAYDYVLWHPERLSSLVVAASGGGLSEEAYTQAAAPRIRLPGFAELPSQFREVSLGYLASNPRGLDRWLEIHAHSRQPGAPAQPLRNEITLAKLGAIQVPALLLPGDNDLTTPPYLMRVQAAHVPRAQLLLIPEAGHSVNWEQPDLFNRAVLEFISMH